MRVVLDTNVLMSGLFFGGAPGQLLDAWRTKRIDVVLTPAVLSEYERVADVLSERYPVVQVGMLLRILVSYSIMAADMELPEPVCADPDDDKFLACALSGGAALVVSGDKALLAASGYNDIEVLKPRVFVDRFLARVHRPQR